MRTTRRPRLAALATSLACTLLLVGCGAGEDLGPRPHAQRAEQSAARVQPAPGTVRIVAAGDIACAPGSATTARACQQDATARLAESLDPDVVLTLGDTQYPKASLSDLRASYGRSWGRLLDRTRPALGNHEYLTSGASGYYNYFKDRQPGPPGYYRLNAGAWKVSVLNSNCSKVSCSREASWLDRKMAAYPSKCDLLTLHHPRYSSGEHGNNAAVAPLWTAAYRHHADVVLSGHDHSYEWFTRMDGNGRARSNGIQSFVVGTGGKDLYHLGTRKAGSRYFQAREHGVLVLDLAPGSFSWAFHAIDGSILDQGRRSCV